MIEQDISDLKGQIATLTNAVNKINRPERWLTPAECAEELHVTRNTVYIKIRKGKIYATRRLGEPRIPMSQFYKKEERDE